MITTDPVADMLTRIRNAGAVYHEKVDIPTSKLKLEIARILKEEGYIKDYRLITENNHQMIRVFLKYGDKKRPVIAGLEENKQARSARLRRCQRNPQGSWWTRNCYYLDFKRRNDR